MSTDRPSSSIQQMLLGDVVFPQARKEIQLETAVDVVGGRRGSSAAFDVEVEYGLTDRLQCSVDVEGLEWTRTRAGRERESHLTPALTLQYSWLEVGGSGLHLAAGGTLGYDVTARAPDDSSVHVITAYDVSRWLHLSALWRASSGAANRWAPRPIFSAVMPQRSWRLLVEVERFGPDEAGAEDDPVAGRWRAASGVAVVGGSYQVSVGVTADVTGHDRRPGLLFRICRDF